MKIALFVARCVAALVAVAAISVSHASGNFYSADAYNNR
jgi:hypothetical protein